MNTKQKKAALAKYLNVHSDDIEVTSWGTYSFGEQEYRVLTDRQAGEACKQEILDSLWAFNWDFINDYLIVVIPKSAWDKLVEQCQGANPVIAALLTRKKQNKLVVDAISADGRGHFLSYYDGKEIELASNLYAYRTN